MLSRGHRLLAGVVIAGAVSLSGCNKAADSGNTSAAALPSLPATLPMTTAPVQQAALAPPPSAIRASQPIRTVRVADPRAAYAYADQASYFSHALGSAPPDYGFDYDGVRPWAWQGDDGSRVFTEPVDGGYRYYYYRAGAEQPYFVRDPDYGYGYDGDQLAVVYGPDGDVVPYADYGPRVNYAAAYLWRAERLYEASRVRQAISAQDWAARQNAIIASRERWAANRDRQADWAAYHAEEAAQQSQYWAREAERRDADQQRFADWRQQDFRSPPPPRAIPERWQQADWARDSAHYAPVVAAAAGAGALAYAMHRAQAPQRQTVFAGAPPQPNDPRGFRDGRPGGQPQPVTAGYGRAPGQPNDPHGFRDGRPGGQPQPVTVGYGREPGQPNDPRGFRDGRPGGQPQPVTAGYGRGPGQPNNPHGFRDGRPGTAGYDRGPAGPPQGTRWQDRHGPQAAALVGAPARPPEAARGPDRRVMQAPAMMTARPSFAGYGHGGPREIVGRGRPEAPQMFDARFHQAPDRGPPASSVTVHEGNRPAFHAAPARPVEARAEAPREAQHAAPPREQRPAEAPRAMALAPRVASFAPPHGGGNPGGHPGGEHPGGGGHEHHR